MDEYLTAVLHERSKGQTLASATGTVVQHDLAWVRVHPHPKQLRGFILYLKVALPELGVDE